MSAAYYAACVLSCIGALGMTLNALDEHGSGRGGTGIFLLRIAVAASIAVCAWRAIP